MSAETPQPGDTVEVVTRTVGQYALALDDDRPIVWSQEDQDWVDIPPGATVTVIDRAPVTYPGTVRREDHEGGHSVWQAVEERTRRYWLCVYSTTFSNIGSSLPDQEVSGFPVIGAAPGTPAAEAEAATDDQYATKTNVCHVDERGVSDAS